jgi:hypothetical protein
MGAVESKSDNFRERRPPAGYGELKYSHAERLPNKKPRVTKAKVFTVAKYGVCPPGQIRNPASGRCVDRDGTIGRRLLR